MADEKPGDGSLQRPSQSSRKKWLIVGAVAMVVLAIALGVGLGVGLTQGRPQGSDSAASSAPTSAPIPSPNTTSGSIWQPRISDSWNYQLLKPLTSTNPNGISVWDIDLFDNSQSIISGIQFQGSRVICYFSAGSYEDWRPDASSFKDSDFGKDLDGWPGEKWLNTNSENVRSIMSARLDIAVQKGCDGVDPDNVDGYNNDNGLGLTTDDSINYLQFLAAAAQTRNLSIGLKNGGEIIPEVIDLMQWCVNEQCVQYDECDTFRPFIDQGKPVFHVEYPHGEQNIDTLIATNTKANICDNAGAAGFSTIIKNMNLDSWTETCPFTAP
jgi:hypothetical protein